MMWKDFQRPKRLEYEAETLTNSYGKFFAQPFERGFGITIGNALRRVLLSAIEGAAITAVKIDKVLHEFSSLPGVIEDTTAIILNLKQVPFKLLVDEPKTLSVDVKRAGLVTAADIKADADVEIIDETCPIATLSSGGKLKMEMRLKQGRSYVTADRNFEDDLDVGYIPIDSVHSPIRKVNFFVEAARLGRRTDYDRLVMEIWTNGSILPQNALAYATKLVKDHMNIFINFEEEPEVEQPEVDEEEAQKKEYLGKSVEELELSVRSYNCLKNANITTIRELVQKTESEMLKTKNFGRKSLNEIKEILTKMNLSLGMKFDNASEEDAEVEQAEE